jgi:hypothetical protein
MSESSRINIKEQRKNKNLNKWCMWRFEVFGKIKYKQLIKQIEFYEKN